MTAITVQNAQRMATLMAGAVKGMAFYPPLHPAITQPLDDIMDIVASTLQSQSELRLGVVEGVFFVEEHIFFAPTTSIEELTERLQERNISGIAFDRRMRADDLSKFLALLGTKLETRDLEKELESRGITGITLKKVEEQSQEGENGKDGLYYYNQALTAVAGVFQEIDSGRIPSTAGMAEVIEEMAALAVQDSVTLLSLSMIKDYDNYTFTHSVNVGLIAMAIAAYLGLPRKDIEMVGMAGFLHDVGKTRISKSILNKPGKLTQAEFEEMKRHTESGIEIIRGMKGIDPMIAQAVLGHHIGYNRQGYPEWARNMSFNSMSEIVAIADSYDAITTLRAYSRPLTPKDAQVALRQRSGTYLNGEVVEKFIEMMGDYPVGTLVRLDTNEIAVVSRPNLEDSRLPTVRIVCSAAGERLQAPVERSLVGNGAVYATIVAVLDPLQKGIDVGRYLN